MARILPTRNGNLFGSGLPAPRKGGTDPTYKEWKSFTDSWYTVVSYYARILPTRNGNDDGKDLETIKENLVHGSYLQGMEIGGYAT